MATIRKRRNKWEVQSTSPQAMPIGHQDHGGVAMAPAVALGSRHQPLDRHVP
jgi:hypothetical protein